MIPELVSGALDDPTPRALKVLAEAEARGWTIGKVSLCARLSKPADEMAVPFYAVWESPGFTQTGRQSWSFNAAATASLMGLSEDDIITYLRDPCVIWPDFEAIREAGGCDFLGCRPKPADPRKPKDPATIAKLYPGHGQYCDKHAKIAIPAAMLEKIVPLPVESQQEEEK